MVTDALFQIWLRYKHFFCIWSLQKYACCFELVLRRRALLRSCQQNSDRQHIPICKRFQESTWETTSTGTGPFDNLKCGAFILFSDQNYLSNMTCSIRHRHVTCLPTTSTNCCWAIDLRHHYLPHLTYNHGQIHWDSTAFYVSTQSFSHILGSFATPSPPFNVVWGKQIKNSVQDWKWTSLCPTLIRGEGGGT